MDTLAAVVLARCDSVRLPFKPLLPFGGGTLLTHVLGRLVDFPGTVIVATTDRPIDDPIVSLAGEVGVEIYRGSATNVAQRARDAAQMVGVDWFARVNGDSPFVDVNLITTAAEQRRSGVNLVTNIPSRTFPYGISVELIRLSAFDSALPRFTDEEREHVTVGLYRRWGDRLVEIVSDRRDLADVRLVVDTASDLRGMQRLTDELPDSLRADWVAVAEMWKRFGEIGD